MPESRKSQECIPRALPLLRRIFFFRDENNTFLSFLSFGCRVMPSPCMFMSSFARDEILFFIAASSAKIFLHLGSVIIKAARPLRNLGRVPKKYFEARIPKRLSPHIFKLRGILWTLPSLSEDLQRWVNFKVVTNEMFVSVSNWNIRKTRLQTSNVDSPHSLMLYGHAGLFAKPN